MTVRRWFAWLPAAALVAVGCGPSPPATDKTGAAPPRPVASTPNGPPTDPAPADAKPKADASVELKPVKLAQLKKNLGAYRGKVLVVDIWAEY